MYRVVECLNSCNLEDVSFVCEDELLLFWVLVSGTEWNWWRMLLRHGACSMKHEKLNEWRIQSRGRPESRKELDSFLVKRAKSGRFECVISRKLTLQFPLILIHLFTYLFTLKNKSVLAIYQSCPCGLSLGIHKRGALETRLNDLSQKRISISSFVYLRLTITPNE